MAEDNLDGFDRETHYPVDFPLVSYWMSIEVFDASFPASLWVDAHGDHLVETAIWEGATDWSWRRQSHSVLLEMCFSSEEAWERFRQSLIVRTALETAPDPKMVIIFQGRGSSGPREPRKPRPLLGSGSAAAALPIPIEELFDDVFGPDLTKPSWLTNPVLPVQR